VANGDPVVIGIYFYFSKASFAYLKRKENALLVFKTV
jgi:hypothetical protein